MEGHPEGISTALAPTTAVAIVRRLASPMWRLVGIAAVLTVAGRHTGAPTRVTLIPVKVDESWYLLAFGGLTDWARNLRAAGRGEVRHKGRTQAFSPIEVDGDERERVIVAYLAKAGPVKRDFERRPAAADHPTFRLEPIR